MKRVSKLSAVIAAAAIALSACGGGTPTSAPGTEGPKTDPAKLETTIKILAPSYADSSKADWERITAKFNKTYPKVKVELQIEGWETFSDKVQAKIQAKDLPDILNDNAFSSSAEAGLLYKMTDILSPKTLESIEPTLLDNGKMPDGTLYATPDIASARLLIYNKDLFTKAGIAEVPKTWAEMEAAAKKLAALGSGIRGYGMPLGKEEAQVESSLWLWGAGGNWTNGADLKVNSEKAIEGFTQMKKMFDSGYTQPKLEDNRQDTTDLFAAGKLGMVIGHGQVAKDAKAKGIKVGFAPVPSKDGKGVAIGVTDFIVAFNNKDAARRQATAAYLELFYSDELYLPWYKGTALLPVTKSAIEQGKSDADAKVFLDALPLVKFQPVSNPQWDTLKSALQASAYKVGTEDPKTLLDQIEAQVAAQR